MFFTENWSSDAKISPCKKYRYSLTRKWSTAAELAFIMLNPSTADASEDDNTIKKCCHFAKTHSYGGIKVLNIFAYRATDPDELIRKAKEDFDIVGPENDKELENLFAYQPGRIVVAWGVPRHPLVAKRIVKVLDMIPSSRRLYCLGISDGGYPRHPFYLENVSQLQLFKE